MKTGRPFQMTLRAKVMIAITVLVIAVSAILSVFLLRQGAQLFRDELHRRGQAMARNLALNAEYGVLVNNRNLLTRLTRGVIDEADVVFAGVQGVSGEMLSYSSIVRTDDAPTPHEWTQNIEGMREIMWHGRSVLMVSVSIYSVQVAGSANGLLSGVLAPGNNHSSGIAYDAIGVAHLGLSLARLQEAMDQAARFAFFLTAVVGLFGVFGGAVLIKVVINPIQDLAWATEQVAQGDLDTVIRVRSWDEVGNLSRSFNKMTRDLKRSREQIERHSQELEQRVKERTQALEDSYRQLKSTQTQLVQAGKLAAVGQLGAGVAHELNNPVGGILGYAQWALERLRAGLDDEDRVKVESALQTIEHEAKRCKEIVEGLLQFSRPSRGERQPVQIADVIQATLILVEHQLSRQGVTVKTTLEHSGAVIIGHASQLQQVLTNLVMNAAQAMDGEGCIWIETLSVPVDDCPYPPDDVEAARSWLRVEVRDNGSGIPAALRRRIFEPFFTTRERGGTGLGLAISQGIIRGHHGHIQAAEASEGGCAMIIWLPV